MVSWRNDSKPLWPNSTLNGSFDLGQFAVFDIIDLPQQLKLSAEEDMCDYLD